MTHPKWIEHWDDERQGGLGNSRGNGVIVTLRYGFSFERGEHLGVKGFDTITEAKAGTRRSEIYKCECEECKP